MTEFNFDIDQIANNTVAKVDKTTEIIETNTGSAQTITFLEKLSPEQQEQIKVRGLSWWISLSQTKMLSWTLVNQRWKVSMVPLTVS